MLTKKELLNKLDMGKYPYDLHNHEALFTVDDSQNKRGNIYGAHSKNLFLKNKKKNFYLFSCLEKTKIELKKISTNLSLGNISFAKEEYLKKYLGVIPGSVTPFGLLNDKDCEVKFFFDKGFLSQETVNFHPLVNTATISLKTQDFINFLVENNKKVNIFDFNNYTLIK